MPRLSLKKMGIICLAGLFLATPQLFAQEEATDSESSKKQVKKDESEIIDEICQKMIDGSDEKYKQCLKLEGKKWKAILNNPNKDPFEPRIVKKVIQAAPPPKTQVVRPVEKPKPTAPAVKPIKLTVNGIVGNEGSRLAIVKFENEELTITKDQIVEGKFKVVDIYADRVVVYSNKEQRRHTFKIGGDDSKN